MHIGTHLFMFFGTHINQHIFINHIPMDCDNPQQKNGCRNRQRIINQPGQKGTQLTSGLPDPPEGRQHHRLEFWEVNLTWQSEVTEGSDFVQPGNYILYI